jgi:hypothetical protein
MLPGCSIAKRALVAAGDVSVEPHADVIGTIPPRA